MNMFKSFLDNIPKNRSDYVNDLDLDDIVLEPFVWTEPDDSWSRTDSLLSESTEECDWKTNRTASTDSSVALSRAMTDSDIDYDRFRRIKNRSFSDPWVQMKAALDAFDPKYLVSVNSFKTSTSTPTEDSASTPTPTYRRRSYVEELRQKMERFFEEECRVFTPDDAGLVELEEALQSLDLKTSTSTPTEDSASTPTPTYRRRSYVEELRQKMERFFEEECRVFTPDDAGLVELEEALQSLDLKTLYSDIDNSGL